MIPEMGTVLLKLGIQQGISKGVSRADSPLTDIESIVLILVDPNKGASFRVRIINLILLPGDIGVRVGIDHAELIGRIAR